MAPNRKAIRKTGRFLSPVLGTLAMLLLTISLSPTTTQAQDRTVEITGREIVERLARLEEGQKGLNQRIDDLRQIILWGFGITFAGIFALIGFVIWDRRTALAPAVNRTERLEAVLKEYASKSPELAEILKKAKLL